MYVSFPHFYLANDTVRETVDGVTSSEKTKHEYFIDIEPVTRCFISFEMSVSNFFSCSYFVFLD